MEQLVAEDRIIFPSSGKQPLQKRYLDELQIVGSIWDDINPVIITLDQPKYPSQKPVELLERIVNMGSNEGDTVLDPFCGSGTTLIAAQKNGRKWIGGDLLAEAYSITVTRLEKNHRLRPNLDFLTGSQNLLEENFPKLHTFEDDPVEQEPLGAPREHTEEYSAENKLNLDPTERPYLHEQTTLLSALPQHSHINPGNQQGMAASPWHSKLKIWLQTNSKVMPAHLEQLRIEFVQRFPKHHLMDLTLEQYALGLEDSRDSFCYWLEFKTRDLGSIMGGSVSKFGVWRSRKEWRWNKIYQNPEDALLHIKKGLTMLISAVEEERFGELDRIGRERLGKFRYSLRCKPLYLYFPNKFLPISSLEHLAFFLQEFGVEPKGEVLARNRQLLKLLRSQPEFEGFDTHQMMRFLYESISITKAAEKPLENVVQQDAGELSRRPTISSEQSTILDTSSTQVVKNIQTSKRDPYRLVGITLEGKYRLDEYAGGGGMGAVYRSHAINLGELVAVKFLKPDVLVKDQKNAILFEREVRAAQRLNHPHIVKVFDTGKTPDDLPFMVMEWLDGQTLEEVAAQNQLSLDRVLNIFEQICEAFEFAHMSNVIHLDVKPGNIFLLSDKQPEDFIKVIDFGMARVLSNESGTTVTRVMGTLQYCSPEHFGGKVSSRSDVYSLGVTLYYLLSGSTPYSMSYINALQHPNLELPPVRPLQRVRPDLPKGVDEVIAKALNRNPDDRQQSVKQLFVEFHSALSTPRKSHDAMQSPQQATELLSTLLPDTLIQESTLPLLLRGASSSENKLTWEQTEAPKRSGHVAKGANRGLFEYQHEIIDSAIEATLGAALSSEDKRAGIVWQTQGTGLSTTTTYYLSQLIEQPNFRQHLIIIAADRVETTRQLWTLFSELFQHLTIPSTYIYDNYQLEAALRSGQHRLIFTTIQRLQKLPTDLANANANIVLLSYNLHGYSEQIFKLFPQAISILFTSNQIAASSAANNIFGDFIYKYSLEQAINDNIVLPVRIERRPLEENFSYNNDFFEGTIRSRRSILESPEFLQRVAEDIISHFEDRHRTTRGKALIAIPNRQVGAMLYQYIVQGNSHLYGEADPAESVKLISSALNPEERTIFTHRFKDPADPFKLAITSGMWLTGMDTPLLNTIYLLKPMSQASLLQVIGRVTRASKDIQYGLVVDYLGLTSML
jgi:serine/threonine protein kinase